MSKSEEKKMETLITQAMNGNSTAQNNLALMYELGLGVDKDEKKALGWWEKAAESGSGIAQLNLAKLIEEQNPNDEASKKKSFFWFNEAKKKGFNDWETQIEKLIEQKNTSAQKDKKVKKILIVDDSNTIRQHAVQVFKNAGYHVMEAVDGLDGLEKVRANWDIGMMVVDVNMPRMGGLEMCEHLAKEKFLEKIPFLMLTTESNAEHVLRAKKLGAKGWMIKPAKSETLINVAKKILG